MKAGMATWVLLAGCAGPPAPAPDPAAGIEQRIAAQAPGLSPLYRHDLARSIVESARAEGVSPALLAAVVETESGYRPGLVSSRHAVGPAGIMPHWVGHTPYADTYEELREAAINVRVGAYVLRLYTARCGAEVLACYNAGPGKRWAGRTYAKQVAQIAKQLAEDTNK